MKKVSLGLLLLAGTVALAKDGAGAKSVSGVYKIKFGEYPGTMRIVQDGDFVCGTYAGDDGGGDGWLGGTLAAGKLTGLQTSSGESASNGYPIALAFAGKKVDGTFKEDSASADKPWTGAQTGGFPSVPNVSGDYTVQWGDEKIVIHMKQVGNKITGTREYLNSGTPAGTIKGTITGNMATGTVDYEDLHGRWQWTHSTNRLAWLAISGTYGVDRDHCDNGGYVKGGRGK
ncbi:MAG: hypothetical protein JWO36_4729 [Myxococcales bacterium]|nr:hypothetical protein [Myxococcales bacterium]